jgi:hypothetical protein
MAELTGMPIAMDDLLGEPVSVDALIGKPISANDPVDTPVCLAELIGTELPAEVNVSGGWFIPDGTSRSCLGVLA